MTETQKLDDHSENGYKVYIPNDCTSINGIRSRHSYIGYAVVPPLGVNLNNDIVKTIYADVNGNNNNRVQGILDGTTVKFIFSDPQWSALNYSCIRDTKGNLIYNLKDYVNQLASKFTGSITNSLHDSTTYTKDDKDVITLKANNGYKIKNASLDYQPYPGAGDQSLGNFTVASDKLTATINIPDDVKNDKTITLTISGETSTDLEHINPSLKADNVSIKITGNTVTLTANSGYKIKDAVLDIGNSLFGDDTPLNFTVSPDKTTASVTVSDESLIDPNQEYDLSVHTDKIPTETPTQPTPPTETKKQKKVTFSDMGYTIYIPNDTRAINGTGTNKDGFKVIPTSDITLTDDIVKTIFADINGDKTNTAVASLSNNILVFDNFSYQQWSDLTTSYIRDSKGNLIYNLQDYVNSLSAKFTGSVTSKIAGVTASLNKLTGVISITIPDNSNFAGNVNVLDSTNQTIDTLAINNNTVTIPNKYATNNFVVDGTLKYLTNYKVDVSKIKNYIDYTADGLIITLTAKQDVTINTLRAVADLTWSGSTYQLDNSVIKIADNKKTATINVPNDYNSKLGYDIVISGDFTKNTPIPINPKATGTLHTYQLDDKTLENFSTKAVETFEGGHNEVYEFQKFITQLYKLPFFIPETESTGTTNILTGWYTINEPARLLNKNHYIKDLGNIKVLPINNNGYDHNVTNCTLYLPFVSPISVSYETILNHTVNVKYDTDLTGAKTTVNIFVDKELYKTFQVSIIENLDLYNIYNDSINGSLSSILNNTLDHCFIKVEYNKPIENLVSYETMEHNKLSSYTNFVKTKNASVSCGTQEEQQEIETLLNGGIYIK